MAHQLNLFFLPEVVQSLRGTTAKGAFLSFGTYHLESRVIDMYTYIQILILQYQYMIYDNYYIYMYIFKHFIILFIYVHAIPHVYKYVYTIDNMY